MEYVFDSISTIASELKASGQLDETDVKRIVSSVAKLKVFRDTLEMDVTNHMYLEGELAWLSSKFEYLYRMADIKCNEYKGGVVKENKKLGLPQWTITGLINSDPKNIELSEKSATIYRVYSYLEKLHSSLRRRETVINYMRKLENGI